jgi:hypothetical protein
MEKLVHCAKCQKPFETVGHGTMPEVAQTVACPYCHEANEVMWPSEGSVATRGFSTILGSGRTSSSLTNQGGGSHYEIT